MDFWQRGLGARLKPKYVHTSCHHQNMRQKSVNDFLEHVWNVSEPALQGSIGTAAKKAQKVL
jgi:hypothetical protein